ncbi:MAG: CDP-glucose 4,6-dehydratase [Anaerolineales bacterium]|nr:CDP-glucose 4,6-dehydratase [Anaerolineales bacterium]
MFNNAYHNRTVLITGHTGFKGSWLTSWLLSLGANVVGFSLPELPTAPSCFELAGLAEQIVDVRGDLRDFEAVRALLVAHRPEIIFHMGAQPIVLRGVKEPKLTFDANAAGTVNLLEAIRTTDSTRALVAITTDKVYENEEWVWGYREQDRLGGSDPYSASKAMAELAIRAYRDTYFPPSRYAEHGVAIVSVRAGNVIGGGDFAAFRLVPDCMKALLDDAPILVRNPHSIRPWQHVLVPLSGYLQLGSKLLNGEVAFSGAWNFGPPEQKGISTAEIADKLIELWGSGRWVQTDPDARKVETGQLRLSWDKAASRLDWQPVYNWVDALTEIVAWFRAYAAGDQPMGAVLQAHIADYVDRARELGLPWVE